MSFRLFENLAVLSIALLLLTNVISWVTAFVLVSLLIIYLCVRGFSRFGFESDSEQLEIPDHKDGEKQIEAISGWLEKLFEESKFNGGVLIKRNGQPLLLKTYGFADHQSKKHLNEHSAFRLASISKQFAAVGILRLVEMKMIQLDTPVANILRNLCPLTVTIRHLLNHTSGIVDNYMELAERHRQEIEEPLSIRRAAELIEKYGSTSSMPGNEMLYSNTSYVLLARVIELVSGKSFEAFMSDELFQPLGMNDTRVWNLCSGEKSKNQAEDFAIVGKERTSLEPIWLDGVAGDGAVFSSLHDMAIWDQFWAGDHQLVSNELLQEAWKQPTLTDGSVSNYGFGWVVEEDKQWHNGSWLGANTYYARYPERNSCLVVLDNSSNYRLEVIALEIETALLNSSLL